MPTPASPQSMSLLARVQRWLGLDDADDAMSECPCAVAARIERAAAEARAKRVADKEIARLRKQTAGATLVGNASLSASTAPADRVASGLTGAAVAAPAETMMACSIAASRNAAAVSRAIAPPPSTTYSPRDGDGKFDRAATYAMGGFFHSGFLADTFVYLPEVWLGGDGEH